MLTKDQKKILEHQRAARREAAEDKRRRDLIEDMRSNTVTVESDAGRDVSIPEAQFGRAMPAEAVISKLKRCNSRLYFERAKSDPTKMGVYLMDPTGRVYVNPQGEVLTLIHICGMESGINPEFSILHKTKKKIPNPELIWNKTPTREVDWIEVETVAGETRGWRTILIRLLHSGLITAADVDKHFGWTPTYQSEKWQLQTS
jgi:hypothetical protein